MLVVARVGVADQNRGATGVWAGVRGRGAGGGVGSAVSACGFRGIGRGGKMSTIHSSWHNSLLERVIHRIFHEIEERTDTDVDKVAAIVEMWEELRVQHGICRAPARE